LALRLLINHQVRGNQQVCEHKQITVSEAGR
jgi:hypothetical protein